MKRRLTLVFTIDLSVPLVALVIILQLIGYENKCVASSAFGKHPNN